MKNVLVCKNCGTENPFYSMNCTKCDSYLRTRVSNIDLWQTAWQEFESPITAGEKIIHSDHKNFVIWLLILIGIKYATLSAMIHNSVYGSTESMNVFPQAFITGGVPVILFLLLASVIIKLLNNYFGIKNRVADNVALYTYCFIPQLLGFLILTPIQFALFGEYFFTFNPSPFLIKPMAAYVLLVIDVLLFLWSLVNAGSFTFAQTKNKAYSVVVAICLSVAILTIIYFLPGELLILLK